MSAISLLFEGDIARITIDNPAKRNALAMADLAAMSAALDQVADTGARALVLTGAGDRAFSGGVDLSDVSGDGQWDENPLTALADKLETLPIPTVARINGKVRGGAVELTLACDFRVGADDIDLWVPATRIGIHYEVSGLTRAISRIGMQATRRIYMLAETMDAAVLDRMGYFDRVVPRPDLDSAMAEVLGLIGQGAPLAVNGMKATLAALGRDEPDGGAPRIAACWASDDLKEGLSAIREKRKPHFKGR